MENADNWLNSIFNDLGSATASASSIYQSWQNFGKSDAQITAQQQAELEKLKLQTEAKRLEYQRQLNATQTASANTSSFSNNTKILLIGGGLLAFVLLVRGK